MRLRSTEDLRVFPVLRGGLCEAPPQMYFAAHKGRSLWLRDGARVSKHLSSS